MNIRKQNLILQYPQNSNKDDIIKYFLLFEKPTEAEIISTKKTILSLWNERKKYVN